jgi:hypothetical protein
VRFAYATQNVNGTGQLVTGPAILTLKLTDATSAVLDTKSIAVTLVSSPP